MMPAPIGHAVDDGQSDPFKKLASADSEQQLLGAIMVNNKVYEHVVDIVAPSDFAWPIHGKTFFLLGQLINEGRPANPVTLKPIVSNDPLLDGQDPARYLTQMAMSVVSVLTAGDHARIVADLARRRELILAAQDIMADAAAVDPTRPATTVIEDAEQRFHEIAQTTFAGGPEEIGVLALKAINSVEAAYKAGGVVTLDTGYTDIDRVLNGMAPGEYVVLGGRPSMGKSAFAGNIVFNAARNNKRSVIFSLEMTKAELVARWIAGLTGISTDRQRKGDIAADEWHRLVEAEALLRDLPISVDDQARLSVAQIRQRARRIKRRQGLDLIVVDHLQLVRQGGKVESRRVEIGDVSSQLKEVAKELEVPILALSQLSRAVEQRDDKRPQLSDLRESGDLEQDADVVMFLFRQEYYMERERPKKKNTETAEAFQNREADWQDDFDKVKGLAELLIPKVRHGKTGVVRLAWDGERQRFSNYLSGVN